jgi:hypothetical protein
VSMKCACRGKKLLVSNMNNNSSCLSTSNDSNILHVSLYQSYSHSISSIYAKNQHILDEKTNIVLGEFFKAKISNIFTGWMILQGGAQTRSLGN